MTVQRTTLSHTVDMQTSHNNKNTTDTTTITKDLFKHYVTGQSGDSQSRGHTIAAAGDQRT